MSIQVKKVGELFDMKLGKMLSGKNYTGKNLRPYLRNLNVQWGRIDFNDVKQMDFDKEDFERYQLKKGDILVCEGGEVGRTAIYNGEIENCCYQNALHRLRPKNGSIIPEYFVSYMSFAAQRGLIQKQTSSVTIAHFTAEKFREFEIPLPDLKTQQKIAVTLEQADTARQKRKQANQLTEQFLQSAFLEMFGELGENSKGYKVFELQNMCTKITDGEHNIPPRIQKGFPLIMARNVRDNHMDLSELSFISESDFKRANARCNPEKGDLLLVCVGATIGRVAIVPEMKPFSLVRSVALIKPDRKKVIPEFLLKTFQSSYVQAYMMSRRSTSAQAGLYLNQIKKIPAPLPPLAEQKKFASLVAQTEKLRSKQRESERELENLFQSLMQRYFG
ncbi:MAG TPA: restriction endonuclease subunit S [Chitinophagales bacterium]|nr:restriction endonuclease subunit S [Chitinophagales bacterium]